MRLFPTAVYHILGDEKFAKFLGAQPFTYRVMVRNSILNDGLAFPATAYLRRHFPEKTKPFSPRDSRLVFSERALRDSQGLL
jgi:hypothetical protein